MPVAISILRGVNLGGNKIIRMEALRSLYESLGFRNVETYIQSGNVLFELKASEVKGAKKRIEDAIAKQFGFTVEIVQRTAAELRQTMDANPFATRDGIHPSRLLICFLGADPAADCAQKLAAIKLEGGEEIRQLGREIFIYFPDGQGRSKMRIAALDKAAGSLVTGRNLNTVQKLLEIAAAKETKATT